MLTVTFSEDFQAGFLISNARGREIQVISRQKPKQKDCLLPENEVSFIFPPRPQPSDPEAELVCNNRRYLYEDFVAKRRSFLFEKTEFWEVLFSDLVEMERESLGLNDDPVRLIERCVSVICMPLHTNVSSLSEVLQTHR